MAHAVTWIGHATTLIALDGVRLLTDPVLTDGFAPFVRRRTPNAVRLAALHPLDAVLISHAHQDHLHVPSLRLLPRTTRIIVPAGVGAWLRRRGFGSVEEVEAGDCVTVGTLRVHVTPAAHQGFRAPFGPRAPALGYVAEGSATVYFAGDTDLFDGMREIPRLAPGGIDLALLPVGGWGPTLRGGHLDPLGAAQALLLLQPHAAMPIHWGTFWPVGLGRVRRDRFEQPGAAFRAAAARLVPDVQVHLPGLGGSVPID